MAGPGELPFVTQMRGGANEVGQLYICYPKGGLGMKGIEAIMEQIYHRLASRIARLPTPLFEEAALRYSREIARLIPEFLNEKKRRVNWGPTVAIGAPVSNIAYNHPLGTDLGCI